MKSIVLLLSCLLTVSCDQATVVAPTRHAEIVEIAPKAMASTVKKDTKFEDVTIRPEWTARLDTVISGIVRDRDRYAEIQKMRESGMPWYIVAGLHERESSRNFSRHLHEGSPLIHRTRDVPKNRLPSPHEPPYTFAQSAEDALYVLKHEDRVSWSDTVKALDAIERYNGLGYRNYHPEVPSPYLYSGTVKYSRGKYISDGRFSATAIDQQVGVVALWKRMVERGVL